MPEQNMTSPRPGQAHFVADAALTPLAVVDKVDETEAPSSLWRDAWNDLRRRPLFWVSAALIVLVALVAFVPGLFTRNDPFYCDLSKSLADPAPGYPFGFDRQGCDVYSRVIYGARASVTVGLVTTLAVVLLGGIIGALAGFYGGWLDSLLARLTDIFFAIPLVLAAIVVGQVFTGGGVWRVIAVLAVFGWPQVARITRGAVMSVKNNDFITAAKSLGVSRWRTLIRHVVPNALAPVVVVLRNARRRSVRASRPTWGSAVGLQVHRRCGEAGHRVSSLEPFDTAAVARITLALVPVSSGIRMRCQRSVL